MAEENSEICGFLNVKFCANKSKVHKVKKRTLGPWKVWKRHWCSFKKLDPELGIRVHLDCCLGNDSIQSLHDRDDFILIPLDATICRTQSRSKHFAFGIFPAKERKPLLYLAGNSEIESQRWMANIRQLLRPKNLKISSGFYNISIIDNSHSKASGLTGLYGALMTNTLGVVIKDIHSSEIIQNFKWNELGQFHLATAGRPDDVKCICVIHTTKEFHAGIGELHVFCLEATKLLQDLVTQGRGLRHKQINRRPLSLSEGDIRVVTRDELPSRSYSTANERMELKTLNKRREANERYEETNCKIPNKMTEDVYQPEPHSYQVRRFSNISTTSGIYEEIPDEHDKNAAGTSNLYIEHLFHQLSEEPPPLPPRQRCASESMKGSRSQDIRVSGPSSLPLTSHRNSVQIERNNSEFQRTVDNSNYVPMSPRLKDITLYNLEMQTTLQENDYVIMR
ncbi:unnamed protein product [Xylocopa violacea]|uniref:PH domain-containing protein n=1 Tax=Xylocopa violacea TaxID=135666 RepID=A0ABP1MXK9_XYLVO